MSLQSFADWLTFDIFVITPGTALAEAARFFIYDTIKIFILLAVIIFAVAIVRSFLSSEKIRLILARRIKYAGSIIAALLGVVTPFCSCSAIPLFLGFAQAGIPLGTTFSFLVASPMINEVALVMLLGVFGWKIAAIYVMSGLVIAVFSGLAIGQMKVDNLMENLDSDTRGTAGKNPASTSWPERFRYAAGYTHGIIKRVWPYIIIGVALGAWIHGYVPLDFLARYAGSGAWYAVPLAVLVGIPLYSNAAGIVPLIGVLAEKGVAMGTILAFMMAVTALSLPEFLILRRVMKTKLIFIFAGVVGLGIVFIGYLFNLII